MGRKNRNKKFTHDKTTEEKKPLIDTDEDTPEYLQEVERLQVEEYYDIMYSIYRDIKARQITVPICENMMYDDLCDFTVELFE